ncbi:aminocarboxymuconate-semialdehyde decarboxylase [Kribbella aluminosa]|uniref:Aminocarboxymuconate-semialdehyde decarboxylase n=1 Tax=Kribbella aluminosa TaxID=416017 RepID=A0ABS4V0K3_9ACTN|nr:amidohydrolase family protein [Kribbella aluminosa]MBP2357326.1 aminocarboxymuconate-semialdehyde decarboxylase [Kribbella aluminosa]
MAGWDVHTHLIPPTVLAAAHRGEFGLSVDSGSLIVDGSRVPLRRLADPAALLHWIAEQDLDGAVVSVPPPLFRYDAGAEWAELVNQGLRELATPQLRVLAHLPLLDPAAPSVAARLAGEGVFSGFALGTLSYAGLDPLWRVLDTAGAFTLIHPGASDDKRLDSFYLSNLLGNPYETGVAAASLVFADVPGRFPGIRFCLCHGGGVTAAVAGRWQRGIDQARPGIEPVSLPVAEALRRFYVDDLVHDDAVLELLTKTFGAERVLAGSDWPFPMGSDEVSTARATELSAAVEVLTRPLATEVSAE